jgi:lysosomal acid lipase/cholesteryl ester hydrolase
MNFNTLLLRLISLWLWLADVGLAVLFLAAEGFLHMVWYLLWPFVPLGRLQEWTRIGKSRQTSRLQEPDLERDFVELVVSKGYQVEEHFVQTSDGYILGLHRLLPRVSCPPADLSSSAPNTVAPNTVTLDGEKFVFHGGSNAGGKRRVVFFQHGFMQNSEAFIIRGPGKSLPYMLADLGYDVWLGNNRGNKYSYKHVNLSPNEDKFWDYCIDHLATFDIPAMLEYVLAETGVERLSYVGFSQGTAQGFAAFSINAKLAQKIDLFVALAPSTRVKELRNPIVAALTTSKPQLLFLLFGKKMMLGSSLFWRKVLTYDLYAKLIDNMMHFLFGWKCDNIANNEKPLLYSHLYSYASVKCMVHWFQITRARRFQMFDENIQVAPWGNNRWKAYALPAYHPSQIKCPMALFCGDRDTVPDTEWLLKEVPAPTYVHREPTYEHLDFLWAHNAPERVYSKVIELIEKKSVPTLNGLSAVTC